MKQPNKSISSTIIIKSPLIKFYDKGFIEYYDDHINLVLLNVGNIILNLEIYKDRICKSTFECLDSKQFNEKYFDKSYKKDFLYTLFRQKNIYFKDTTNGILIKVK